ncbi:hypothetical protein B2_43 [Stenotrophomonas phage B2]|nr:hypothetical protein B2_43 [Stenotrophomonas phage B2]
MNVKRSGGVKKLQKTLDEMRRVSVEVGYFPEAVYPDGTPVAYVAAIHVFGYLEGNIPPRDYFRTTTEAKAPEWGRQVAGAVAGAIQGKLDFKDALAGVGAMAAGDIGKALSALKEPELAESTIRRKGHDKPLVGETGLLLQSLDFKVNSDA